MRGWAKAGSSQNGGAGWPVASRKRWYSSRVTWVRARRNGRTRTSCRGFSLSRGPPPIQKVPPGTSIHSCIIPSGGLGFIGLLDQGFRPDAELSVNLQTILRVSGRYD